MSDVVIVITPPGGSPQDITDSVVFGRSSFSTQMNGVPGTFDIYVRDPTISFSFTTGTEVALTIDTVPLFGGYITQVGMTSFAPAADTSDLETYDLALWHLSGSDYNIVFDRRIYRNTADYLDIIKINETIDGAILRAAIDNYTDMGDFDTSGIDNIATIPDITHVSIQQGWLVRKEFETLLPFSGAVYYINGSKVIQYKAYDDVVKRWGFSDAPNHAAITASPDSYQGATYGFSSVTATEDGTYLANDVFVWGGSEFAGSGGTVFHRATDQTSIDDHNRWQHAETHFGETLYKSNAGVTAVANAILNGPPGTDATGQQKGLKHPQSQYTFTWFSDQVPKLSGVKDHIFAGDIVTIDLTVFGVSKLLPVRSLNISFPDAFELDGTHLVQFDGTFGLQLSDSFTLWRFIVKNQNATNVPTQNVVGSNSTSTTFGAYFQGQPTPAANGSATVFTIPFGYILGTTQVFLNTGSGGFYETLGTDYTESDHEAGQITFTTPPPAGAIITVVAFTLSE